MAVTITGATAPVPPAAYATGTTAASAAGWCSPWSSSARWSCWCRSRSCCSTRSSRPADYSVGRPAELADASSTPRACATFWTEVNFPQKLWNSALIAGVGGGARRRRVAAQRVRAGHRPGEGPAVDRRVCSCWPTCCRRRRWSTRCTTWPRRSASTTPSSSVIIIFTVIQSAFGTYLLASVLRHVPAARCWRRPRWTAPARGTVLWRVVFPICRPTLVGAAHLLLHLDLERVPHPAGHADRQRNQTIPVALGVAAGRPADGRHRRPTPAR